MASKLAQIITMWSLRMVQPSLYWALIASKRRVTIKKNKKKTHTTKDESGHGWRRREERTDRGRRVQEIKQTQTAEKRSEMCTWHSSHRRNGSQKIRAARGHMSCTQAAGEEAKVTRPTLALDTRLIPHTHFGVYLFSYRRKKMKTLLRSAIRGEVLLRHETH